MFKSEKLTGTAFKVKARIFILHAVIIYLRYRPNKLFLHFFLVVHAYRAI